MFKGTYHHRLDGRGRLPVPAVFRRALEEAGASRVVVTQLDQCLAVYPPDQWRRLESHLASLPPFSKQAKALTRLLLSRAADCDLDVQGRILVPPTLRAAAGLARDAVVVGVLDRFEIWAPAAWESFVRDSEQLLDDASFEVGWPPPPVPAAPPARPAGPPSPPEPKDR